MPASARIAQRGVIPVAVCAVVAVFVAQPAVADEYDVLNVTAAITRKHDDNVRRVPDSSNPQSDFINVYNVGLHVDKPYSLQRFQLSASKTLTRYDSLSTLDYNSLDYRAAWLWALTPRLTGTLSDEKTQSQIPFAQVGGTQINQRTSQVRNFSLDGWVGGAWHVLAGYGQTDSTTDQAIIAVPAFESHHVEGGLRYVAASGNSITFMQRWIPTDTTNIALSAVNLIDTNYTDTESELSVNWKLTGTSSFDGNLTYKTRDNVHFSQRNFSGAVGAIHYHWTPTGKLTFNVSAERTMLPFAAFGNTLQNSTDVVNDIVSLGTIWKIDAKLSANMSFSHTHSEYRGPVFVVTAPARVDNLNVAQLGIDWNVARYLLLSASLIRTDRATNTAAFQFTDNSAFVTATLNF